MKKLAAILLVIIFLFNLFGYRILIHTLRDKAEKKMEAQIDQQEYNEESLLEIRVAMNMPYQTRYTEYERHYGQISIEGKEYIYVKRKIEGDTLILKCIPNQHSNKLNQIADDITFANTGNSAPHKTPGKSLVKIFTTDCEEPMTALTVIPVPGERNNFPDHSDPLPESVQTGTEHPPQTC